MPLQLLFLLGSLGLLFPQEHSPDLKVSENKISCTKEVVISVPVEDIVLIKVDASATQTVPLESTATADGL